MDSEEPNKKITESIKEKAGQARNAIVFKALKIGFFAKNAKDKVVEKVSALKTSSGEKATELKEQSVEAFSSLKEKVLSKKEDETDKKDIVASLSGSIYRKPGEKSKSNLVKIKSVPWFNRQLITPLVIIMIGVCFLKWLQGKDCDC